MTAENHEPKTVTIIINGRSKELPKKEQLTFEEVVQLAFPNAPTGEANDFSVQYTRGHGNKPAGTMRPGDSVKAKEGMEFDVTPTNRS